MRIAFAFCSSRLKNFENFSNISDETPTVIFTLKRSSVKFKIRTFTSQSSLLGQTFWVI